MGRRKNRQAGEKTTSEYDSEPEEMVCGEEEEPGADMEEGGALGVADGVLGTLGAEESRLRCDVGAERRGARGVGAEESRLRCDTGAERRGARGVPNEEIRDLLLTVSQSVSHITGALQHVVAVLQKKDSEVGHVEVDKNQTHAYLGGSIPRGTREEFPWQPVTEQTRHTESRDADEKCMMEPANREPSCSGETHYKPMQSSSSVEHGLAERGRYTRNQVNEGSHRNMMQMELEGCAGVGPTQHLPQRLAEKSGYSRDPANEGSNRNCNRFQFEPDMTRGVGPNQHQPQNRRHSRAGQMLNSGRQEAEGMDFRGRRQGSEGANRSVKIPPFNGKEEWKVWINRFEIIAFRHMWSKEEKLDNLIPRIEGNAAEFIFSQLPQHILYDFDLLVGELNNRYRRIKTPRTFSAKFSSRNQKNGETAEEYAAELKSLYDRAHGFRDAATRQEDLVRRFLDGLWDDEARFEVEFHKEPTTIDEAVYFVVCLIQTKRQMGDKAGDRQRRPVREARNTEEDEVLDNAESIGRVPGKFRTGDKGKLESARGVSSPGDKNTSMPSKDNKLDDTKDILKLIMEKLEKLVPAPREQGSSRKPEPYVNPGVTCFRCGEKGHYARDCQKSPSDLNRHKGDIPLTHDFAYLRSGWQEKARKVITAEHAVIMPDLLEIDNDAHMSRETWVKCQHSEEEANITDSAIKRCDLDQGQCMKPPTRERSSSAVSAGGPEITSDVGIIDVPQPMRQLGKETRERLMEQKDKACGSRCLGELGVTEITIRPQKTGLAADRTWVSNTELVLQPNQREHFAHTVKLQSTRCKPPRWLTKVKMRQKF